MTDSPHVLAIIPIRGGDAEVNHGRMVTLVEKPLLAYTIEAGTASRFISRIVVSTDDAEVAQLAKSVGAEVLFLRPPELAIQGVSLSKVLQHALLWLEEHEDYQADIVVLLEITHPIRPSGLVDQVIELLLTEELDSVFVAREERHEFWAYNSQGLLERVKAQAQAQEETPRQMLQPLYKEMGGVVTAMKADLVRQGKRLGERVGLVPLRDMSSLVDLHDEDGFKLASMLVQQENGGRLGL